MGYKIKNEDIISRYESLEEIWPADDKWHSYTHNIIYKTLHEWVRQEDKAFDSMLNIGSGGYDYDLKIPDITHIDLCSKHLPIGKSVVCDAQNLPFLDSYFDVTICVGSVLNYCDAAVSIAEMSRIIKPKGILIIEFEKSENFEYFRSNAFCANSSPVTTFYAGKEENLYVYSEEYIHKLLTSMSFVIKKRKPIHILSSMFVPLLSNQLSAKLSFADSHLENLPFFKKYSSNVIFICEKTS